MQKKWKVKKFGFKQKGLVFFQFFAHSWFPCNKLFRYEYHFQILVRFFGVFVDKIIILCFVDALKRFVSFFQCPILRESSIQNELEIIQVSSVIEFLSRWVIIKLLIKLTKGQLISKCLYEIIVWTKIPTNFLIISALALSGQKL